LGKFNNWLGNNIGVGEQKFYGGNSMIKLFKSLHECNSICVAGDASETNKNETHESYHLANLNFWHQNSA